ncbi:MAG TPA: FAD-binding protein, partial [Planctomycetia bacterium]|nr:FAD-binding protein [Planctomycetia bacterium]
MKDVADLVTERAPLAPRVGLGVGGPARYFAIPKSREELLKLSQAASAEGLPLKVLGAGSNVLAPDEGVEALVLSLSAPAFTDISSEGNVVRAGAGALLYDVIAFAAKQSLSGLENLAGIPGTIGGAVRTNAGTGAADMGQFVRFVETLEGGEYVRRLRSDIKFGYRQTNLDDAVLVEIGFDLMPDRAEDIVRRLKKVWIAKRAQQPFGFQRSAQAFRNPRGLSAATLIEQAGLAGTK